MYETIKEYHDSKGRQLSLIFMKLPNKNEYPDYYEVIKQPIHMEKIAANLKSHSYDSLEELVSDFILMFDNACKYNEPDSQIYKVTNVIIIDCLKILKLPALRNLPRVDPTLWGAHTQGQWPIVGACAC